MNALAPFIGIDFGTSNSRMAWYNPKTNQAEIIMNAEGELETPSVVYFGGNETRVGSPALERLEYQQEREQVILSVKRELISNPRIALPDRSVKPVEVAAEVLRKLKRDAEEGHFHQPVTRAVVTYPASFGPLDRDKIREATRLAGFSEMEMVEEPVAAAMAYTRMGLQVGKYVLVYDLGGGTFDLAVLAREDDGLFHPALEPQGIKRCGGDDFDEALYTYCDAIAREKLGRAISLAEEKRDLHFLHECRKRKENLSNAERHMFNSLLSGDVIFRHEVTRATFENLIGKKVEQTVRKTKLLLEQASAERQAVDTVVLIGGSSRVPLVKRLLEGNLPLKPLQWQYQDTAVALGAAYYAQNKWGSLGAEKEQVAQIGRGVMGDAMADQYYCVKCKKKTEMKNPNRVTTKNGKPALKGSCAVCGTTVYSILGSEKKKETLFENQKRERYLKAVKLAWSGNQLDKTKIERLTARGKELALSKQEMTQIEREVMGVTKEVIFRRQRQEQYRKAVEAEWRDRKVDATKITRLTALAKELELSKEQVAKIEREVMGQLKQVLFTPRIVPKTEPVKPPFVPKTEPVKPPSVPLKTRLLQALQTFQPLVRFYVSPNIPKNKLANARDTCNVPQSEEILGLLDCTFFGSAKDCVLFGTEFIYHRNVQTSRAPGKILYSELSAFPILKSGTLHVAAGNGQTIDLFGSAVSAKKLCDMLNIIERLF